MLHVDEIMRERVTNAKFRDIDFHTADGQIYFLDKGVPKLAITREEDNPVLRHLNDAFFKLDTTQYFYVSLGEAKQAIASERTIVVNLLNLDLKCIDYGFGYGTDISHFCIPTTTAGLNHDEKKLVERVFGQGDAYAASI